MSSAAASATPFRLPDEPAAADLVAKYFRALGDPTRLRILRLLAAHGERSVSELVAATGDSQPKISNHLACLRWCGFVTTRRQHRSVHYSIADPRVVTLLELAHTNGLMPRSCANVSRFCVPTMFVIW